MFGIRTWSWVYSGLNWQNLKKLDVSRINSFSYFCSLKADSLLRLRLCLVGDEQLDSFLSLVNNFQHLTELRVNFASKMEISESEVLKKIGNISIDSGYSKVKFLYLNIPNCEKISMSILAWFPMLEYLTIQVENYEKKRKVKLEQIVEFNFRDLGANLSLSNIWNVLPFLKVVKVKKLPLDTVEIYKRP